jgi:hypothetical protein
MPAQFAHPQPPPFRTKSEERLHVPLLRLLTHGMAEFRLLADSAERPPPHSPMARLQGPST